MWNNTHLDKLKDLEARVLQAGGASNIEKQHAKGKMTARERLEQLYDKGSFVEIGALRMSPASKILGDAVVTGYGKVNGRLVYAAAQDFTLKGGTLGKVHAEKICAAMDMALACRSPFVSLNDSGGARIEEGVDSLDGYSGIFYRNTIASGIIPQISVILGPCAGGACYAPALCDYIFMTRQTSQMFITGPAVVKEVMREEISAEDLGGADAHGKKSGVAHFVYDNDNACIEGVRQFLSLLPQSNEDKPLSSVTQPVDASDTIEEIVPDNMKRSYDVHNVINTFIDKDTFFEVQKDFAKNVVVGLGRLNGDVIGIVANQPSWMAGSLDIDASAKAARFVRFCDCFNIPLLSLVDVPGYMPGSKQEHSGIIRHGAKLLYAYSEATVPKVTLIMRKAFGGAYIAMNSKSIGADLVLAWPIAQIAVMGAEGAVNIINRKDLAAAADPVALRQTLIAEYEEKLLNPYIAAERGYIDEVILPKDTKKRIVEAFEGLKTKKKTLLWKKHGNIPL
ncbi:MAG: acyl-CoA carboxylase subunit beta [Fibrobacteraceae bacterium]|nr:acyl-CoA carboxylase subunit beta [Fibrobacteraceae bacterium]